MFHNFHAIEGREEIRTAGDRAVIGEEKCVVVRNVGFEDGAEIGSAGRGVSNEWNFSEANNDFRKEGLIESLASGGEPGGGCRMGVTDRLDIGTHLVKEEMHASLGGDFAIATKVTALHIHDDKIIRSHGALVEASGSGEDAVGIEADGEIPLPGNDVAALVQPATYEANITAVLLLGARSKVRR
jgi:hypothetical protein